MAVRARPGSDTPVRTVAALEQRAGFSVPGRGNGRNHRLQGLGALSGSATGLVIGGLAGGLRAAGVRLPTSLGGPLLGTAAMLATNLPMTRLRITDPRSWSGSDWAADAVPHLAYGLATNATLVSTFRVDERAAEQAPADVEPTPPPASALLRAGALGAASGCRSSSAMFAVALRSRSPDRGTASKLAHPARRTLQGMLAAGELGLDKHPSIPDRVSAQGIAPRVALSARSAATIAHRDGYEPGPPAVIAAATGTAAALAGTRLRTLAHRRFGSDLPGALVEDALTTLLAWYGARRQ